jgi:hypothetical protein
MCLYVLKRCYRISLFGVTVASVVISMVECCLFVYE